MVIISQTCSSNEQIVITNLTYQMVISSLASRNKLGIEGGDRNHIQHLMHPTLTGRPATLRPATSSLLVGRADGRTNRYVTRDRRITHLVESYDPDRDAMIEKYIFTVFLFLVFFVTVYI